MIEIVVNSVKIVCGMDPTPKHQQKGSQKQFYNLIKDGNLSASKAAIRP